MTDSIQPQTNVSKNFQTLVIEAEDNKSLNLRDLFPYRDLLLYLAWRDIAVRYKQTALGIIWAVLQPFMAMVVFSVFFGNLLGVDSGDVPYPLFAYAALLPWQYFSSALNGISMSLINNEALLTKVYFPRLIIPFSAALPPLVDLVFASVIYFVLMIIYGVSFTWNMFLLPFFLLLAIVTALGFGTWIATSNVQYRDFRYIIQFLLQIWLFASPVTYASDIVPEKWQPLYNLNPMVGVIDGFRWVLLGSDPPAALPLLVSVTVSVIIFITGLYYFRRTEGIFADIV